MQNIKNFISEILIGNISKILGLLNVIILAKIIGVSKETDFYTYLVGLIISVSGVILSLNSTVFLPKMLKRSSKVINIPEYLPLPLLGLIIALVFMLIIQVMFHSNFEEFEQNKKVFYYLLFIIIIVYSQDFLCTILRGKSNLVIPNIAILIGSVAGTTFLVLFRAQINPSYILILFTIQQVTVFLFVLYYSCANYSFSWKLNNNIYINFFNDLKFMPLVFLDQIAAIIVVMFPTYLLSQYGSGQLTAVGFSRRLYDLLPIVFIVPIVNYFTPSISQVINKNDNVKIKKLAMEMVDIIGFFLVPLTVLLLVNSQFFLSLFFVGKNFSSDNIELANNCLVIYLVALLPVYLNAIITKFLILKFDHLTSNKMAILSLLIAILIPIFTYIGSIFYYSLGVILGYVLFLYLILLPSVLIIWKNIFNFSILGNILTTQFQYIIFSVIAYSVAYFFCNYIYVNKLINIFLNLLIFTIIYLFFIFKYKKDVFRIFKNHFLVRY